MGLKIAAVSVLNKLQISCFVCVKTFEVCIFIYVYVNIPSKLLLVISAIDDKGNVDAHQLLQTPIEKVQTSNRKQEQCS